MSKYLIEEKIENGKNSALEKNLLEPYIGKGEPLSYGIQNYGRRDDLEAMVESEIKRVFSNKELNTTITELAKFIKTPEDYVRIVENGLRANLSKVRGIENIETPEEAAYISNFLAKYTRRFVEVLSTKIGHPEYIPIGIKVANKVLEEFMDNFK